jgi:hypothetical protein
MPSRMVDLFASWLTGRLSECCCVENGALFHCGAFRGKETIKILRIERGCWRSSSPFLFLFILGQLCL